mgnify:CR=1 FL=1
MWEHLRLSTSPLRAVCFRRTLAFSQEGPLRKWTSDSGFAAVTAETYRLVGWLFYFKKLSIACSTRCGIGFQMIFHCFICR